MQAGAKHCKGRQVGDDQRQHRSGGKAKRLPNMQHFGLTAPNRPQGQKTGCKAEIDLKSATPRIVINGTVEIQLTKR